MTDVTTGGALADLVRDAAARAPAAVVADRRVALPLSDAVRRADELAASGNFGQVIRRNYPIAVGTRMDREPSETVQVVGALCTPLDLLGDKVALPRAEVGDLVVLFQAGAYGLTASPTAFLSHPAPVEVLV